MKKLLLSIISFAVCQTISGQQISRSNNRYRGNDALEKKQITVKGFDLSSKKSVWNLEDAELSKATYQAEYTTEMDTLMAIERGSRTYYRQDRDVVSIIGSENVEELISYDKPETWLRFPMQSHRGHAVMPIRPTMVPSTLGMVPASLMSTLTTKMATNHGVGSGDHSSMIIF